MAVAEQRIFRIEIDERLCKGCSICVDFCPTDVLKMDGNLVVVKDLDACNGCQLCDNRRWRRPCHRGESLYPCMQAKYGHDHTGL